MCHVHMAHNVIGCLNSQTTFEVQFGVPMLIKYQLDSSEMPTLERNHAAVW